MLFSVPSVWQTGSGEPRTEICGQDADRKPYWRIPQIHHLLFHLWWHYGSVWTHPEKLGYVASSPFCVTHCSCYFFNYFNIIEKIGHFINVNQCSYCFYLYCMYIICLIILQANIAFYIRTILNIKMDKDLYEFGQQKKKSDFYCV